MCDKATKWEDTLKEVLRVAGRMSETDDDRLYKKYLENPEPALRRVFENFYKRDLHRCEKKKILEIGPRIGLFSIVAKMHGHRPECISHPDHFYFNRALRSLRIKVHEHRIQPSEFFPDMGKRAKFWLINSTEIQFDLDEVDKVRWPAQTWIQFMENVLFLLEKDGTLLLDRSWEYPLGEARTPHILAWEHDDFQQFLEMDPMIRTYNIDLPVLRIRKRK